MDQLALRKRCPDCPYPKSKRVGPRGNPKAKCVLVGESPGRNELRDGMPFTGESGTVLFQTLGEVLPDLDPENDLFITNALMCFPHTKDQRLITATHCCHKRLLEEIREHPREMLVAMGNPAMWSLTGNYALKITQDRGRIIPSPLARRGLLPAVHPAALLRGIGNYSQFQEDVRYGITLGTDPSALPKAYIEPKIIVCDTTHKVKRAVKLLKRQSLLAADAETSGFSRQDDHILCLGIAYKPELVFIFPGDRVNQLRSLFRKKGIRWLWHNGKFDCGFLWKRKVHARVDEDTMLLSYALDEHSGRHDLEQVMSDLLGSPDYKWMVKEYAPKITDSFAKVPRPILYRYLGIDVSGTLQSYHILRARVQQDSSLEKLYTRTLIPASKFYACMEQEGLPVDRAQVDKNKSKFVAELEDLQVKLDMIAGYPINPRSPSQISRLLYDDLRLPKLKGTSTDKSVLVRLPDHPAVVTLREFRKTAKALDTYITGKRQGVEKRVGEDGRVHTTVKIHGTVTGRPSSAGPNIFNIPRNPELRAMFVAPVRYVLLEADLNQAELRSLAFLSKDKKLCAIYNDSTRSLHHETAVAFFGKDYTDEQKMRAKAVNFGIVYGREAPSLAEEYDISVREAQRYIAGWLGEYPQAADYIKKCRRTPRKNIIMTTMFGRKKRHGIVTKSNLRGKMNEASNFPHQSIASDITLHGGIILRPQLLRLETRIVNSVYDSIITIVPHDLDLIQAVVNLMTTTMESVPPMWGIHSVPFKAEAKIGTRWGYLTDSDEWFAKQTQEQAA
jgi:uracil-DNA glycosylase family 4